MGLLAVNPACILGILDLTQPFGIKDSKANIPLDQNKPCAFAINE